MKTMNEILMPTKGNDSYEKIAIRANEWFRKQIEAGRSLQIGNISIEQVRKIFIGLTARPDMIYLEVLSSVQNVSYNDLLKATGYHVEDDDPLKTVVIQYLARKNNDTPEGKKQSLYQAIDEILEELGEIE